MSRRTPVSINRQEKLDPPFFTVKSEIGLGYLPYF